MDSPSICKLNKIKNFIDLKKISDFLKDESNITVYSIEYGMANTTLAGEKSDVKINHASIASGNLSLMANLGKKKSILGKKTLRKPEDNIKENSAKDNNNNNHSNSMPPVEKKLGSSHQEHTNNKSEKSKFFSLIIFKKYLSSDKDDKKDKKSSAASEQVKVIKPKAVYKDTPIKEAEKEKEREREKDKKRHIKVESENSDEEENDEDQNEDDVSEDSY